MPEYTDFERMFIRLKLRLFDVNPSLAAKLFPPDLQSIKEHDEAWKKIMEEMDEIDRCNGAHDGRRTNCQQ